MNISSRPSFPLSSHFGSSKAGAVPLNDTEKQYQYYTEALDAGIKKLAGIRSNANRQAAIPALQATLQQMTDIFQRTSKLLYLDPLLEVYNRRYFDKTLEESFQKAKAHQESLSLLMLDLDHFGQINKRYGHPVGDMVLKMVARQLKASTRAYDSVCRYGGEEFAILLPNTSLERAQQIADRILKALPTLTEKIRQHNLGKRPRTGPDPLLPLALERDLTTSIGLASISFPTHQLVSAKLLLESADKALGQAKNHGRNQICLNSAS